MNEITREEFDAMRADIAAIKEFCDMLRDAMGGFLNSPQGRMMATMKPELRAFQGMPKPTRIKAV